MRSLHIVSAQDVAFVSSSDGLISPTLIQLACSFVVVAFGWEARLLLAVVVEGWPEEIGGTQTGRSWGKRRMAPIVAYSRQPSMWEMMPCSPNMRWKGDKSKRRVREGLPVGLVWMAAPLLCLKCCQVGNPGYEDVLHAGLRTPYLQTACRNFDRYTSCIQETMAPWSVRTQSMSWSQSFLTPFFRSASPLSPTQAPQIWGRRNLNGGKRK